MKDYLMPLNEYLAQLVSMLNEAIDNDKERAADDLRRRLNSIGAVQVDGVWMIEDEAQHAR